MADGENMADSFVSQQIMKVTSRDPGLLGRMGPDSRGTGSPTLVRTGEDSGGHCSKTVPITLRSPAEGEALRGVNAAGQGFGLTAWTVKISDKAESKGQDCPKLVTQDTDRPKEQSAWANSLPGWTGGSEGGTKEMLAETRKQRYWQMHYDQTLSKTDSSPSQRVQAGGARPEIPFTKGWCSIVSFLLSPLSFLPSFLSICFRSVV